MANRRMFSFRIINSAKFLQMPIESQNLYFHLGVRADDDGVAEAYPVIRLLGTTPDALRILEARGFIKTLNDELVIFVTDWLEHNNIRADRKVDSLYKDLLEQHNISTKEAKPRSDVTDNSNRIGGQSTDGIGKVRLGKVSSCETEVSRESELKESSSVGGKTEYEVTPTDDDGNEVSQRKPASTTRDAPKVFAVFKETIGNYQPIWVKNRTERMAAQMLYDEKGIEKVKKALQFWNEHHDEPYIPEVITPHKLATKWDALIRFRKKHGY